MFASRPCVQMQRVYWCTVTFMLFLTGCARTSPPEAPPSSAPAPEAPPTPTPTPTPAPLPQAPWRGAPLPQESIPGVFVAEWSKAPNRATCALPAPASLGAGGKAVPRRAEFSGGWAVAYDLPEMRSAFGVAGTGAGAEDPSYAEWPHRREWADGSSAEYGPEGGTGPNQLAYLRVAGQTCLYNVWSRIGVSHLEYLLEQLRFVDIATKPNTL